MEIACMLSNQCYEILIIMLHTNLLLLYSQKRRNVSFVSNFNQYQLNLTLCNDQNPNGN